MALEKAPAFQFYPKDFLTDSHVVAMNLTERGAYITLLCMCWMEQSLPADLASIAKLCRVSQSRLQKLWPAISSCFVLRSGRLIQPRLDRERHKQEVFRQLKSNAGKKGGRPKHRFSSALPLLKQNESKPKAEAKQTKALHLRSSISDLPSPICDLQSPSDQSQDLGTSTDPRPPTNTALAGDGRFTRFWAVYPNKKGKDEARKAWQKRNPSDALTDLIIAAVARQQTWPEWTKDGGRFIPHPATWLNRGSWDDEPTHPQGAVVTDITRANLAARDALLERVKRERA